MKILTIIWLRTANKGPHKKGDYYGRCLNCGGESPPTTDLSVAMSWTKNHHKHCRCPNYWTQESRELIHVEMTFG